MDTVEVFGIGQQRQVPIHICPPAIAVGSELSPGSIQRFLEARDHFKEQSWAKNARRRMKMAEENTTAETAEATPAARPGRASQFAGRRIYFDGENKRREGSSRHTTIEVLRANQGATLEELVQLGAKREDILFEMKHNPNAVRLEQA